MDETNPQFSPVPWTDCPIVATANPLCDLIEANGKLVAMVYVRRYDGAPNAITTIPDEEGLANKHLILTSGRLYHALAKITDEAQFGDRISDESIIEALAAMKEARGE